MESENRTSAVRSAAEVLFSSFLYFLILKVIQVGVDHRWWESCVVAGSAARSRDLARYSAT
jgi:hypothetical protein